MERKKKANTLSIVFLRLCTQGFHSLAFSALISVLIITLSSPHTMVSSSGCATASGLCFKTGVTLLGFFYSSFRCTFQLFPRLCIQSTQGSICWSLSLHSSLISNSFEPCPDHYRLNTGRPLQLLLAARHSEL